MDATTPTIRTSTSAEIPTTITELAVVFGNDIFIPLTSFLPDRKVYSCGENCERCPSAVRSSLAPSVFAPLLAATVATQNAEPEPDDGSQDCDDNRVQP